MDLRKESVPSNWYIGNLLVVAVTGNHVLSMDIRSEPAIHNQ